MLGVDERRDAAVLLGAGDGVQRDGGLAARFGAEDFDDPAARQTLAAQGDIEAQRAGGDALHVERGVLAELHDGALAELLFDLGEGILEFAVNWLLGHGRLLLGWDKG